MQEFGRQAYADTVYINFDSHSRMAELFDVDLNTDRLIMGLELYAGRKIDPDHSLLIFDEVQEVPRALASLKYFMKMHLNITLYVQVPCSVLPCIKGLPFLWERWIF